VLLENFESPSNTGEHFGSRVRGFVAPPVTGVYTFWIASDDESSLFLSTDKSPSNMQLIACVVDDGGKDGGWTNYCQWTKYESQQSPRIELQAGKIYYIEALHSQGGKGDHMEVAWQIPGATKPAIVEGQYLSPWPTVSTSRLGPPQVHDRKNQYSPEGEPSGGTKILSPE